MLTPCPHCGVKVLARADGSCPLCDGSFRESPPAAGQPESPEGTAVVAAEFAGAEPSLPSGEDLRLVGKRSAALRGVLLVSVSIVLLASQGLLAYGTGYILALLGVLLVRLIRHAVHPPRIAVREGRFCLTSLGQAVACPASNVALGLVGSKLAIRFADLSLIEPAERQPAMVKAGTRGGGFHLQVFGGFFSGEDVARIRRALGAVASDPEGRFSRIEEFERGLVARTPHATIVSAIVLVNLAVFAVVLVASGSSSPATDLVSWGANYGPRTLAGEPWRLLASMFLHFGAAHVLFNMYALWDVGRLVERLMGSFGFAVLYLLSGLAGSLASVAVHPAVVSAGASGAVFGVYGALLGTVARSRSAIPVDLLRDLRATALAFVAFNLIFGFLPGIDMAAHVGGLLAGFLIGLVLAGSSSPEARVARALRGAAVAVGGLAALALTFQGLPEPPADLLREMARFAEVEARVMSSYNARASQAQAGRVSDAEFADFVEKEVLPPWRATLDRLGSLENVATIHAPAVERLVAYMRIRASSWELLVKALREGDPKALEEHRSVWNAAERAARRFGEGKE